MTFGRCFFLDVGQGTANVIMLKGRRALVIDAGPVRKLGVVHRLLKDFALTIECVLLSHHDRDHIAGWEQLAQDFEGNIGAVWCILDAVPLDGRRIDITMYLAKEGKIPKPKPAIVDSLAQAKTIWSDPQSSLSLEVLYPDLSGMYAAIKDGDPNRASVVAALRYGDEAILFPGDCDITAWRRLKNESPHLPLNVDVVAVPHHGGLPGGSDQELTWLYSNGIKSRVAVVSAGSSNDEGHPHPQVVRAMRAADARIMCTQITPNCHPKLEQLRPGVMNPLRSYSTSNSKPSFTSSAKRSRDVGCAGTVVADLENRGVVVKRTAEHLGAVSNRVEHPLCLP